MASSTDVDAFLQLEADKFKDPSKKRKSEDDVSFDTSFDAKLPAKRSRRDENAGARGGEEREGEELGLEELDSEEQDPQLGQVVLDESLYDETEEAESWEVREEDIEAGPEDEDLGYMSDAEDEDFEGMEDMSWDHPFVQAFQRDIRGIVENYTGLASDEQLLQDVCYIANRKFRNPFSRSRQSRLTALSQNEARENLLQDYFRYIPLRVQYLLGSGRRDAAMFKALPKGRVASKRKFLAGSPSKPLKRKWTWTDKRGIYGDFMRMSNGTREPYIGSGIASKRKYYLGVNGRLKHYLEARRNNRLGPKEHNPHMLALVDERNAPLFRVLCEFDDEVPLQLILLLEDIFTIYFQSVKELEKETTRYCPEMTKVMEHCAPATLPTWPHQGLNAVLQSSGNLVYSGERRCMDCGKNREEILQTGRKRVWWIVADPKDPFGALRCRACNTEASVAKGFCSNCPRVNDRDGRNCSYCLNQRVAKHEEHRAAGRCICGKEQVINEKTGEPYRDCRHINKGARAAQKAAAEKAAKDGLPTCSQCRKANPGVGDINPKTKKPYKTCTACRNRGSEKTAAKKAEKEEKKQKAVKK